MTSNALLADLQAENARLIALLEAHNIEWKLPTGPTDADGTMLGIWRPLKYRIVTIDSLPPDKI